ncbi:hypothetical protein [Pantoea septica]|uniref:Uncharacterized protein n=1 Tax=Pantoea septica TaxID=472695 RepID=A0ABX3UNC9_9GAMM|nr:hypothetical protein [Pantoea septica]ORM96276.1 hypothetical protein HA46_17260 [Pantoea septica]
MDAATILRLDLQNCNGDIHEHELVIREWLEMDAAQITNKERSHAMHSAFGSSFEADEALNRIHADLFGSIIRD